MTTWAKANGVGMLAAAQAHGDYGIDTATWPIDIYDAIYTAGVVTMWQQMPRQFGAYVNDPGSRPGVLINNGLPHAAQRQTAGHELGHHWWKHGTREDGNLDPPGDRRPPWPPEEKLAESFAAWFLMPRKAAMAALDRLGIKEPAVTSGRLPAIPAPGDAVPGHGQAPAEHPARHPAKAADWIKVPPNVIKDRLDQADDTPTSRKPDVWVLSPRFDGAQFTVHPGDRLVINGLGGSRPSVTCPEGLTDLPVRSDEPRDRDPGRRKNRANGAASRSPAPPGTGSSPYKWKDSAVASTRAGWADVPPAGMTGPFSRSRGAIG